MVVWAVEGPEAETMIAVEVRVMGMMFFWWNDGVKNDDDREEVEEQDEEQSSALPEIVA